MLELLIFSASLFVAWGGVAVYLRWSKRKGIVDRPNERSSHVKPTPRGGGLVIAAVCLIGYVMITQITGGTVAVGYIAGSLLIVAISWLDDIRSVSSVVRLVCHTFAALLFIADSGSIRAFEFPGMPGSFMHGWLAPALTAIWIVWLVNAYNFMDGIDGIAGQQAVLGGLAWSVIAYAESAPVTYYFGLVLAASAFGFLIHNWQPARIFMGDAGSAFLGFTFGSLPLMASVEAPATAPVFVVGGIAVVWFFVLDTTLTFALRLSQGKKVWVAHREHLYQRLVISGKSHGFVAALYGFLSALAISAFFYSILINAISKRIALLFIFAVSASLVIYTLRKSVDHNVRQR